MEETPIGKIEEHFGKVKDRQIGNSTRHKFLDLIVVAICAVVCGADGWSDVALFGKSKMDWFKKFLELPHGIPSHDTFGRVFGLIDPEEFQRSFLIWVRTIQKLTQGKVVAIDGKQLHGSEDEGNGQAALDMVSAWATANQLVLGQVKVDEKSNEIPAIPRLHELLDITGCIVTIDAIGTQTEIAKTIVDQGGDYLLRSRRIKVSYTKIWKSCLASKSEKDFLHRDIPMPGWWMLNMAGWKSGNAGLLQVKNVWITCVDGIIGSN